MEEWIHMISTRNQSCPFFWTWSQTDMHVAHPVHKVIVSSTKLFVDSLVHLILTGEGASAVGAYSEGALLWTRCVVISQ